MNENDKKLKRKPKSSIFSIEEQLRLLNLIQKEKYIIENKITNKISNEEKEIAWENITNRYNANTIQKRSVQQIKTKYDNLKTKARKELAEKKRHLNGIDDGNSLSNEISPITKAVLSIIGYKTVEELEYKFDCDKSDCEEEAESNVDICNEQVVTNPLICEIQELKPITNIDIASSSSSVGSATMENIAKSTLNKSNWRKCAPKRLQTGVRKNLRSRVRLIEFSQMREEYYRKKTLYIEVQKNNLINQEKRSQEEHEKKMILLDLEIKLKEEELRAKTLT